ncbi:MAG TPA: tRNA 2-thiouridine(34) synthase MnmA [Phycisphaerae bacterium]|nr:tRNA 2-thiouridine(34) synthase MnmA [Phycisphaerae bacterium]
MPQKHHKVVVAMSGGVDSSVAAALLAERGCEIVGLYMCTGASEDNAEAPIQAVPTQPGPKERHLGCCSPVDAADARAVAQHLKIPFYAVNFRRQFDGLIDFFADEYLRGRTPNPCVLCNRDLKFGRLVEYGRAAGADFIATGHYARVDRQEGIWRLRRAIDQSKDQSYVLFGIGRDILPRTLFPLGELTKQQVREHARRLGLKIGDKPESQDICFAPDRDYARVVRERHPEAFHEGAIVDAAGRQVGTHAGIAHFTIGQRRGTGVAAGSPVYVVRIDAAANTVVVGPKQDLARDRLDASRVQWLIETPPGPIRATVKIRYAHAGAPATVKPMASDRVCVRFDEPQTAITPGQAAVFYDDDVVLGGGWID